MPTKTSNNTSLTTLPAPGAATWFANANNKSWTAIAAAATINSASAGQEVPFASATNTGICDAWNPAAVDQVRGEYLMVGNGGHGDYGGNEVYALQLRVATPQWYRLNDRSPNAAFTAMGLGTLGIVNVTVSANAVVTLSSALSAERIAYFPLLNCTITNFNGAWAAFSGTGTMSITNSTTIQTNINTLALPAYSGNGGELSTLSTGNATNRMGGNPAGYAGMFIDGRRRAHHGWYDQWFFNGKSWNTNQGSCTGVGNSTSHAWSFDRSYAVPTAMPTAPGQAPQAWQNNAGPWKWLGTSDTGAKLLTSISGDSLGNSPAVALDPVTGIIWYAHGDGGNWFAGFGSLNTATEALVHVDMPQPCQQPFGHSAICVDPAWDGVFGDPNNTCRWRFFVFFPQGGLNQIAILDLKAANPYLPASWTIGAISSSTGVATVGNGAVYHKASRSVICANPVAQQDGIVYKVRVPTNPATGVYVGGTWNVSPINPDTVNGNVNPGLNQVVNQGGGNAFGKLRLVESISGGQDGIVICSGVTLPTYVYKLPAAEIV